ncbi:peptide/nickel transport system permease protein [Aquamicrobium terrae]|uniref:Peptide/nickel transport system permease protein n=2 Tax=Aquamicrobium terrae TaxID=1324945 RepID=A0ABV2N121_9HYPH
MQALLVVFAMTLIVFMAISFMGNPVDIMISPDADQADRAKAIAALGLDLPVWQQYLRFLGGAIQGEFGRSFVFNEPAIGLILSRMPATLELAVTATLLSIVIGLPLGLYAGLRPDTALAKILMGGSILGFSLPSFLIGLFLIAVFAVELQWLPSTGRGQTAPLFGIQWSFLTADGLRHLMLPALNLALYNIALIMRLTRAGVAETMQAEYIRFARAKGLTTRRIVFVHVLKSILIPIVTVIGMEFGITIALSVVTETVFAWPGMGKLMIDSIGVLDRPVIVAYLMISVLIFVLINFLVDIFYTVIDPRADLGAAE